jgi:hypothetical protein
MVGVRRGLVMAVHVVIAGAVVPPFIMMIAVPSAAVACGEGKAARDQDETDGEMTN